MQNLSLMSRVIMRCKPTALVSVLVLFATGCVSHIKPYKPKRRTYELPVAQPPAQAQSSGSIFNSGSIASRLMTDPRAQQINDLVIIKIDERASAHDLLVVHNFHGLGVHRVSSRNLLVRRVVADAATVADRGRDDARHALVRELDGPEAAGGDDEPLSGGDAAE